VDLDGGSKLSESPKHGVTGKGTVTLAFAALFAITLVTVHVVEPETNFGPISLYSLGPFGIVMRIGFVGLALAFFSLVAGLRGRARPTILYNVDLIMLSVAGAGLVTVGAFNTDAPGTAPTLSGLIHSSTANIWSICALVGILLFAVAFRQDGRPSYRTIIEESGDHCNDNISRRFFRLRNVSSGRSAQTFLLTSRAMGVLHR
jgi:hypothetical protein